MVNVGDTVQVRGYRGVAFTVTGYPQRFEPVMVLVEDEDGEECEVPDPDGEGEWIDDAECGRVIAVMVGDDREHEVDEDDCAPLAPDQFCSECGQVGCCHGLRS